MRHTLLPLRLVRHVRQTESPPVPLGIISIHETNLGHKTLRLPGPVDARVELIHLFERQALGFVNHAPDEGDADEAAGAPDEEDFGLHVGVFFVDEVGRGVGDTEVAEEWSISWALRDWGWMKGRLTVASL